jgi:hypothetical protein
MTITEQPTITIDPDGTSYWRLENGRFHRTDGPAYEDANGDKSWWLNDKQYCHTCQNSYDFTVGLIKWCKKVARLTQKGKA